jgi:hypothetical protein
VYRDMHYVVDLRHPLQAPCGGGARVEDAREDIYPVVEAVGMWESRRDFQRVWEGWKAGIMAFHAFHTLSFPWPVFRTATWINQPCHLGQRFAPPRNAYGDPLSMSDEVLVSDDQSRGQTSMPVSFIATL